MIMRCELEACCVCGIAEKEPAVFSCLSLLLNNRFPPEHWSSLPQLLVDRF